MTALITKYPKNDLQEDLIITRHGENELLDITKTIYKLEDMKKTSYK